MYEAYKRRWFLKNKKRLYKKFQTYNRSFYGKLVRMYLNAQQRVKGQDHHRLSYKGMSILDRQIFYKWAIESTNYCYLWQQWKDSNYELKLTPTIDRLDKNKGYILSNIEIVTLSENVKRR